MLEAFSPRTDTIVGNIAMQTCIVDISLRMPGNENSGSALSERNRGISTQMKS
jgi:hypothetical protein